MVPLSMTPPAAGDRMGEKNGIGKPRQREAAHQRRRQRIGFARCKIQWFGRIQGWAEPWRMDMDATPNRRNNEERRLKLGVSERTLVSDSLVRIVSGQQRVDNAPMMQIVFIIHCSLQPYSSESEGN